MLNARWGRVGEILAVRPGAVVLHVEIAEAPAESGRALAYPALTGPVAVGDRVLVNTTAVRLRLGTGGLHFVMAVDRAAPLDPDPDAAHLMKLRYTPLQHTVSVVEEAAAERLDAADLGGCRWWRAHNRVASIAAGLRAAAPTPASSTSCGRRFASSPSAGGAARAGLLDDTHTGTLATMGRSRFSALVARGSRRDAVIVAQGR